LPGLARFWDSTMSEIPERIRSRRDFIKLAAGAAASVLLLPESALPQQKTLKIAKWAHFVPEYDRWFEDELAAKWGKLHDTQVIVDHIPVEKIGALAASEVAARKGHDLILFPWPPAEYQQHAIDHAELYRAVAAKHGEVDRLGHRSTFDPNSKKYFAFCDSWIPTLLHFFQDYWAQVNMPLGPVHYYSLRSGGQRLRAKLGVPCGLALTPGLNGNVTLHTLLYAFNSRIRDASGKVVIYNGRTVTALEYAKDLYRDAGASEQLAWGPSDNVRAMLARKTSATMHAASLSRIAEAQEPEIAKKILLEPLGGSAGVVAVPQITNCSAIWTFAENQQGAKQFLVDLIDKSRAAYEKSKFCNFSAFPRATPELIGKLTNDPRADPSWKYQILKDAPRWTVNLGHPGFADPVAMEVFNTSVVPRMFLSVVKGERSAGDAAKAAEAEVARIVDKWKQASA
jgi:multiple sugar transport system substrate-binding protein